MRRFLAFFLVFLVVFVPRPGRAVVQVLDAAVAGIALIGIAGTTYYLQHPEQQDDLKAAGYSLVRKMQAVTQVTYQGAKLLVSSAGTAVVADVRSLLARCRYLASSGVSVASGLLDAARSAWSGWLSQQPDSSLPPSGTVVGIDNPYGIPSSCFPDSSSRFVLGSPQALQQNVYSQCADTTNLVTYCSGGYVHFVVNVHVDGSCSGGDMYYADGVAQLMTPTTDAETPYTPPPPAVLDDALDHGAVSDDAASAIASSLAGRPDLLDPVLQRDPTVAEYSHEEITPAAVGQALVAAGSVPADSDPAVVGQDVGTIDQPVTDVDAADDAPPSASWSFPDVVVPDLDFSPLRSALAAFGDKPPFSLFSVLFSAVSSLRSDPVTPSWSLPIFPGVTWDGSLQAWDDVASILRSMLRVLVSLGCAIFLWRLIR